MFVDLSSAVEFYVTFTSVGLFFGFLISLLKF